MEHKREIIEAIDQDQMLDKFRTTELCAVMMQHPKENGDASNLEIIKLLFGKESVFWVVKDYINGKIEKSRAVEIFKAESQPLLKRFSKLNGFFEDLFNELIKIAKAIYSINQDVEEKVEQVMETEPEEVEEKEDNDDNWEKLEITETFEIKLKKGDPETIDKAKQIEAIIKREGKKKDHSIVITRIKNALRVSCPTSDSASGKKLDMGIMPNEEYVIGMASQKEIEKQMRMHEKIKEETKHTESRMNHYYAISPESIEYKQFRDLLAEQKNEMKRIMGIVGSLKQNPLLHWFDPKKSTDIGREQLIIEFRTDGTITITDDGEKGETILKIRR